MTSYDLITGLGLIFSGALISWVGIAGRKGILRPNFWIGIRTPAFLSLRKWVISYKAASPQLSTAGGGLILFGIVSFFVPYDLMVGSLMWLAIFLVWGGIEATKAAKQA